ncbi:MAG: hypothetical protein Q4G67_07665 [Actinomycetia bacterium]|nr:hypothetical protein [Actinomycetes bacterium]
MDLPTSFLNGESLTLSTDAGPAAQFGTPIRSGVLFQDNLETEVHAGDHAAADFFFEATGSREESRVQLRGGAELVTGAYGGRTDQGLAFRVDVGDESLYGVTAPVMTREALAALLSSAGIGRHRGRVRLRPAGAVSWSPHRTQDIAVTAADDSGHSILIDVRRARRERRSVQAQSGRRVRGGHLSRSDPTERVHVILEAPDVVAYGLPTTEDDLDLAVQVLADVVIDVEPEAPSPAEEPSPAGEPSPEESP